MNTFFRLTFRGIADLGLHPMAHFLALVAVAMVSLLAGFIIMALFNVNQEILKSRGRVEFQVYWQQQAKPETVVQQWDAIRTMPDISDFKPFTPNQALNELASTLDKAGDFGWLAGENPLPYSALVSFAVPPKQQQEGWAAGLLREIKSMPGVEKVTYTPLNTDLAQGWVQASRAVVIPVIGFLGLVVALVVGNTVRLSLMTRQDEIEILALVGAKPWYIRWPLLTSGAVLGLLGSATGVGLLKAAQVAVRDSLNVAPLFITVEFVPALYCAALCGAVTLVAVMAGFFAVRD